MRRRSGTPTWGKKDGHPYFAVGDMVGLNGNYNYPGWVSGEARPVLSIEYSELEDRWTLAISNPKSPFGVSKYNPRNFTKDVIPMAYERTKFFAVRLNDANNGEEGLTFKLSGDETGFRDSKYAVQQDVAKVIKHGEQWLVLQTVAMIEGEEPRPPIRVTEYK